MVGDPNNLSKVKTVCQDEELYDLNVVDFIDAAFAKVLEILKSGLHDVLETYKARLDGEIKQDQPHPIWNKFLAGRNTESPRAVGE